MEIILNPNAKVEEVQTVSFENKLEGFMDQADRKIRLERAMNHKMDKNEKLVRKTLVKVWTRILEKYATPGAFIPDPDAVYRELYHEGVESAIKAVVSKNWFVFSGMVRSEIETKVAQGLSELDLNQIIADVRIAQHDAGMLEFLREEIKNHVLNA